MKIASAYKSASADLLSLTTKLESLKTTTESLTTQLQAFTSEDNAEPSIPQYLSDNIDFVLESITHLTGQVNTLLPSKISKPLNRASKLIIALQHRHVGTLREMIMLDFTLLEMCLACAVA